MKTNSKLPFIHGIKRTVSVLLSILIVASIFTALPFTVGAVEEDTKATEAVTEKATNESKSAAQKGKISTGAKSDKKSTGDGETSGTCGDDLTWSYNSSTTTLTISGTGAMYQYTRSYHAPWYDSYKSTITTVVINSGATTIGNYAFYQCSAITSISIPSTVTTIGEYAFSNCNALSNVTIPNGVTTIKTYAFYGSSLSSVTLPSTITSLGERAIYNSNNMGSNYRSDRFSNLINLYITDLTSFINLKKWGSNAGCIGFYDLYVNGNKLTSYTFNNDVPDFALEECQSLTSVSFGSNVTSIGKRALQKCWNITSVNVPNSVTTIDDYAFRDCKGITGVTMADGVITLGQSVFEGCCYLSNLTLSNNITSIGAYAFSFCEALISITIPDSVRTIDYSAFESCSKLTTVTISNNSNLESIGNSAFAYCKIASRPNYPQDCSLGNNVFQNCPFVLTECGPNATWNYNTSTKTLTISGSGNLYEYNDSNTPWYSNLSNIRNVIINGDVNIGNNSIGRTALTSITVTNSTIYDSRNNCNAIIETATNKLVRGCKTTTIPSDVTSIDDYAFSNCTGLTSLTIPDSVTAIGMYAFSSCTNLTSITIPSSVTSLGSSVFSGCTGLTSMPVFNENVTSIPNSAFNGCTGLTNISIPSHITSIGTYAFNGCTGLTNITIPGNVTTIGQSAFHDCTNLSSVTLQQGVRTIGSHAFSYLRNLTSITIPSSVISIYDYAFYNCSGLTNLTFGSTLSGSIGQYAFQECSNLTTITVPEGVRSIGRQAFAYCDKATVVLPSTITGMGDFSCYLVNRIAVPVDSTAYNLLTSQNFTRYRSSRTEVVGIVSSDQQFASVFSSASPKNAQPNGKDKGKISTGAAAKNSTGADPVEEQLTAEEIAENLSHIRCYLVDDVEIDERVTFDANNDVVLHLNDFTVDSDGDFVDGTPHTLEGSTSGALIEVPGDLTIKTTGEGKGGITNDSGSVFDVKDGGSLTIENGNYSDDVSEYVADNKVMGKTGDTYTVLNAKTADMTLDNDGRQVIMPSNQDTFDRTTLAGVQHRPASAQEVRTDDGWEVVRYQEAMRFVSVVRSDILRGAEDYGYVLVKGKSIDNMNARKSDIYVGSDGCTTVSLKGSKNTLANTAYSSANLNEGKYKYLTAAIKDIDDDDTAIGARFYIKRADGTYVYADYTCCATMGMIKAA